MSDLFPLGEVIYNIEIAVCGLAISWENIYSEFGVILFYIYVSTFLFVHDAFDPENKCRLTDVAIM